MEKFRIAGLLIIGLSFLYTPLALGEITTMGEAINKAGRQRMLTQRVLKAYFQMGMNVQYDFASKQLRSAVNLFDRQLAELQEFAPNAAIKKTLAKVKKLWVPFKAMATADVDRKKAGELRDMGEEVLRTAHKAVLQLQDSSGTSTARLVNIAGRQRMLSQRLC
ncbi:MAG: hypothetical protein GY731_18335, partial [Gammaproteobacteria bacterium]|nr:hypothetical protein [Gammaproteobacteria bacterium]